MRFALTVGAVLALALGAGSAHGDTFTVVDSSGPDSTSQAALLTDLPSAQVPNIPGALVLPSNWTSEAGEEVDRKSVV
jgi:hypothetical protein